MNDSEIIKALECCSSPNVLKGCEDCPLKNKKEDCRNILDFKVLDLIKRQQTYIERLQEYYRRYNGIKEEAEELRIEVEYAREKISQMEEFIITIESETVRKLAEQYKKEITERYEDIAYKDLFFGVIDRLVEEMTEGEKR